MLSAHKNSSVLLQHLIQSSVLVKLLLVFPSYVSVSPSEETVLFFIDVKFDVTLQVFLIAHHLMGQVWSKVNICPKSMVLVWVQGKVDWLVLSLTHHV